MPELRVAEATVRRYVRRRKQELGLAARETFVPQSLRLGQRRPGGLVRGRGGARRRAAQTAVLRDAQHGQRRERFIGPICTPRSRRFWKRTSWRFDYFGGVFRLLRYDNLKSAVKKILRGHQREETARFIAFRSHWGFQSEFCNPAKGNEKGGVEGEVGYFRRNHWCRCRRRSDLEELNAQLLAGCREDEQRRIARQASRRWAKRCAIEREHLLPLAERRLRSGGDQLSARWMARAA